VNRVAVLASGGLDSSVLLADLARGHEVTPVYVRAGLAWEELELHALQAYLRALHSPNVQDLTVLDLPVRSLYGNHWSTSGENVPGAAAPDIDVYLPGRNVLLLGITGVWCAINGVHEVAIGSLAGNPFPDATPEFFADYGRVLSSSMAHELRIIAPYRELHKAEIIAEFPGLPLEKTLTCMSPRLIGEDVVHCGACNKCNERQVSFGYAGVEDRTVYAA